MDPNRSQYGLVVLEGPFWGAYFGVETNHKFFQERRKLRSTVGGTLETIFLMSIVWDLHRVGFGSLGVTNGP